MHFLQHYVFACIRPFAVRHLGRSLISSGEISIFSRLFYFSFHLPLLFTSFFRLTDILIPHRQLGGTFGVLEDQRHTGADWPGLVRWSIAHSPAGPQAVDREEESE